MTDSTQSAYVPGVCNINRDEIAYRRKAANVGTAIFLVLLIAFVFINSSNYYRVILFLPAFVAAVNYLQVKNKFCVMYGGSGQQNADEGSTGANDVGSDENKAADKAKARKMNLQALVIAIAVTAIAIAIPHI